MERRELMKYTLLAAPAALLGRASGADSGQNVLRPVPDARLTAPLTVPASGEIRVAFQITPGAEVIDFAGPWGVFEYVTVGKTNPFQLYTVAASKDPVEVSGGMIVTPNFTYFDSPAPDVIVVPATDTEKLTPAAFDWLRSMQKDTPLTMSVCDGSFVLAQAGLLDGKSATSHHSGYGMLHMKYPKVTVVRGVRYVEDGKIASSGGLTSGMDLALRVVERYFGRDVATQTALALEYQGTGWMFPQSNVQFAQTPVGSAEHPICTVCAMQIDPQQVLTRQYHGKTYYFCSASHLSEFVKNPRSFLTPA